MRQLKTMLAWALFAIIATACQQNKFKIEGTAEGLSDGDTLILSKDLSDDHLSEKITIQGGAFKVNGIVDSVRLGRLYVANRPDMSVSFFLEPGTIKITLMQDPMKSQICGTESNDAWQELNNLTFSSNEKMQQLAEILYDENTPQEKIPEIKEKLIQLHKDMIMKIIDAAEKNLDNEVGFFIVTHFDDDNFTPTKRRSLIDRMPAKFRNRGAIKEVEEELKMLLATEKGHQIQDFSLPTSDGNTLRVMNVVKENKLTILDFWASWCAPCRMEMPNMVKIYEQYHSKGLEIVGISLDESREKWIEAIKELGLTWPQTSDLKGWQSAPARQFNVKAIPHIVIIDQKGIIKEKDLRGESLEHYIAEQLK